MGQSQEKYEDRLKTWGVVQMCNLFAITVYETFIRPVLGFVAQLESHRCRCWQQSGRV